MFAKIHENFEKEKNNPQIFNFFIFLFQQFLMNVHTQVRVKRMTRAPVHFSALLTKRKKERKKESPITCIQGVSRL